MCKKKRSVAHLYKEGMRFFRCTLRPVRTGGVIPLPGGGRFFITGKRERRRESPVLVVTHGRLRRSPTVQRAALVLTDHLQRNPPLIQHRPGWTCHVSPGLWVKGSLFWAMGACVFSRTLARRSAQVSARVGPQPVAVLAGACGARPGRLRLDHRAPERARSSNSLAGGT